MHQATSKCHNQDEFPGIMDTEGANVQVTNMEKWVVAFFTKKAIPLVGDEYYHGTQSPEESDDEVNSWRTLVLNTGSLASWTGPTKKYTCPPRNAVSGRQPCRRPTSE